MAKWRGFGKEVKRVLNCNEGLFVRVFGYITYF